MNNPDNSTWLDCGDKDKRHEDTSDLIMAAVNGAQADYNALIRALAGEPQNPSN